MAELRYELKFVAPLLTLSALRSQLNIHPERFRRHHASRQVNSIYFDTIDLNSYEANLIGNAWRNKLRLRWYGMGSDQVETRLELKYKENLLGGKLVFELPEPVDLTQSYRQIQRHLLRITSHPWHIPLLEATQPTLLTQYFREYFVSADKVIRVTLDYKLKTYDQRLSRYPNLRRALPLTDQVIIELKAPAAAADQLEETINHLPLLRVRYSKYVTGVQAFLF